VPRAPRTTHPGAIAHVTNRGAAGQDIFLADGDHQLFLWLVENEVVSRGWACHAFCLMSNHYHLLLKTPEGDLSAGMHAIGSGYANMFNRVHERRGHVFQGRFHSVPVQEERHAVELARYIALNPVRAGLVRRPSEWRWSSYAGTVNGTWLPHGLRSDWFLRQFGSSAALRAFVEAKL
jgi:putative transposase